VKRSPSLDARGSVVRPKGCGYGPAVPHADTQASRREPGVIAWGLLEYCEAERRQRDIWEQRARDATQDVIAVVEHPPVITLGRNAPETDVLLDRTALGRYGIALARSDRGGRATYHGPGQAVVYPIVAIAERGLGVKAWVALLEGAILDTLGSFGVEGRTLEGRPGVWVADAKIASLGLRVARGVSYHGVSINVEPGSLEGFAHILTCGVAGQHVTCIAEQLERLHPGAFGSSSASVQAVAARFCRALILRLAADERS